MNLFFIRLFFLIISIVVGYYVGGFDGQSFFGAQIGFIGGVVIIVLEASMLQAHHNIPKY